MTILDCGLMGDTACPACGHDRMDVFFEVDRAPVFCNVLWGRREEAVSAARAAIRLGHCRQCDLIYNVAFDPKRLEYTPEYENALDFSPTFQKYLEGLACGLVERYGLREKDVVEIGCGQGSFLALLAGVGNNRCVGFDPSFDPTTATPAVTSAVRVVRELYSEAHSDYPADLICCRQTLEHVADPLGFLKTVRRAIGDRRDTVMFFEVPNALHTLNDLGVWDIIYEHCSYFTVRSLRAVFERVGFSPTAVTATYGGQFLTIEAVPLPGGSSAVPRRDEASRASGEGNAAALVGAFGDSYRTKVAFWREKLAAYRRDGIRTVVWGAGSKGITFLNVVDGASSAVAYVVDVNPRKHGRYVTGTELRIVPPEFLRTCRPGAVVVMNSIYRAEIERTLEGLGVSAEVALA